LFSVTSTSDDDAGEALEVTLAACADDGAVKDCLVPKHAGEERDLWRIREDWAVDRARPGGLWFDVSVPTEAVGNYLEELRLRLRAHDPSLAVFIVGHLADGNLHVTVNAPWPLTARYDEIAPLVYAGLKERGGSFSAEHGIGLEKRAALEHWAGPVQLALMRSVKKVFDPSGIMNRGKVLG
jgi:FAD/FMN-containing dehydrogenase